MPIYFEQHLTMLFWLARQQERRAKLITVEKIIDHTRSFGSSKLPCMVYGRPTVCRTDRCRPECFARAQAMEPKPGTITTLRSLTLFCFLSCAWKIHPAHEGRQTHKSMWCYHVARSRPIFVFLCITPFHNKFKFFAGCIIFSAWVPRRGARHSQLARRYRYNLEQRRYRERLATIFQTAPGHWDKR